MSITIGDTIPDLTLAATGGRAISLRNDFRDRYLVLFFYPKASTPGCTQEGQDFRDAWPAFDALGASLLGASRDGVKAQENFQAKQGFPYPLLSDKEEQLCLAFDVIKMKKMYGREVRGIERSTFVFDRQGVLRQQWRGVKVKGHVEEVRQALLTLQSAEQTKD